MMGSNDSGLTGNAWTERVEEIRQMVSDVQDAPTTAEDVEFYIEQFDLEFDDERECARREFARQYGVAA